MHHIIEAQQFSRKWMEKLFLLADRLEKKPDHCMENKIMASLFYEPSTRTRFSFESAMLRLGGGVITTENAREFSSVAKGETLVEDTIRVVNNYADVIVLRHFEEEATQRAATVSKIPIINAGDGAGQHPTQALLDLYTIQRELGNIDGISIAFVGDLKYGRTVHSLCYLLGKYRKIYITFVSPPELSIKDDIKNYLRRHRVNFKESQNLKIAAESADVIYMTRIQKERIKRNKEKTPRPYILTTEIARRMKRKAIIMHPLPRLEEISPKIDFSDRAVYFKQVHYGLLIRMALLWLLMA